ncbi:MAG: hypothetical protein J6Y14_11610 [Fibrobacter sp.]|nr:hypothetical protein [Fibrobacter sp.]
MNLAVDVGSLGAKHVLSTQTKEDCPTKMLPTSGPAPADNTNTSIPYLEE